MIEIKRKVFTVEQKAKVALAAIKGHKTVNEIVGRRGSSLGFCLKRTKQDLTLDYSLDLLLKANLKPFG